MIYQALYRKYRPKNFSEVSGQTIVVQTLKNMIINNKITHAYLFIGPRGTGKTSIAKIFAKTINCENSKDGISCDDCEICKLSNNNENIDIIEMDAASNNGVDEIREIKNHVTLLPSFSKYKIYIIDEVHMLSQGAFNALLKTLEEPPKHVIFILATTEPQKVPLTIISRCQCYEFKPIPKKNMILKLEEICEKENISFESEALKLIADDSNGGMRDAIGLLDQLNSFSNGNIKREDVLLLSGKISIEKINELIDNILEKNIKKCFEISDNIEETGKNFIFVCEDIIKFLKENIIEYNTEKNNKLIDKIGNNKTIEMIFIINEYINQMKNINDKKIYFDLLIVKLIELSNPIEQKNIENKINANESKKINQEKTKNVSKINVKTEKNYDLYNELMTIRLNNILRSASKSAFNMFTNYFNTELKNSYDLDDLKINNIFSDCSIKAGSNDGIIVTTSNKNIIYELYDNINLIENKLKNVFKNDIKLCVFDDNSWMNSSEIYRNKIKNKEKIDLLDESEIIKQIENNIFGEKNEFDDLIEYGEVN